MKRFFALCSLFLVLLSLCGCKQEKRFQKTYIDYFDTVVTIIGYEKSEKDFNAICNEIEPLLDRYHKLFDIYNSYNGINNIYTINNAKKEAPVVDKELIDLIEFSKEMYALTNGQTNIAMGSVLKHWHNARLNASGESGKASIPDISLLKEAAKHCDINDVIIDKEKSTVFLNDPQMRIDVGAVAKGYAMQKVYEHLETKGVSGYALNFGGMVKMLGKRGDGQEWTVAVENPISTSSYVPIVSPKNYALSTSGSYQRYFEVDGVRYHHIIDPDTLMPENNYLAVSVLTENCAEADVLSTALFNMSLEDAKKALAEREDSVGVMWVFPDGKREYFGNFKDFMIE